MIEANELEYWASLGNRKRVEEALARNPDVNIRGAGGYTAMHAAAENGHLEVLRLLIARGGAVNARTDDGRTPLDLGAGYPEIVAFLRSVGTAEPTG
jgi:uncharacterized protein